MKARITISIKPEDANKALVKGMKAMSREHARSGRSLRSQVIPSKKGGESERRYPKRPHVEDLDEEELEEIRVRLEAADEE